MADHIDHAAEALKTIASGKERGHPIDADSPIAEAQVHATLALVEQQRIANIIALGQFSLRVSDSEVLTTKFESAKKWHADAVKSLGL